MPDCLFCKIVAGEIPCYKIYEDDYTLAFLDIHPCALGHVVVIPKQHFDNLSSIDADSFARLSAGLQAAANRVRAIISPDGMNVGLNDNPPAGQAVPHTHWHIIPRFENDGGGSMHSIIRAQNTKPVEEVFKLFQK